VQKWNICRYLPAVRQKRKSLNEFDEYFFFKPIMGCYFLISKADLEKPNPN